MQVFEVGPDDVILHPQWHGIGGMQNGNDIALVRLPEAVTTVNENPEVCVNGILGIGDKANLSIHI